MSLDFIMREHKKEDIADFLILLADQVGVPIINQGECSDFISG